MLIEDWAYFKRRNKKSKYRNMDHPNRCEDAEWFKNYPVQDYDYSYNSWGFRGPEYDQYIGKKVNICLGDSFTSNTGGPIEHSWPSLLQEHFDIPCLNLGMDGAGNDSLNLLYHRACKVFDVQNTFVVYSYLHRRLEEGVFKKELHDHLENVKHFEKYKIPNCIFQFLPHWCYTLEEQEYVYNIMKPFIPSQTYWKEDIQRSLVFEDSYNSMKGESWPTYKKFINGADPHSDIISGKFKLPCKHRIQTNRDGHHMSLESNQKLVESLIEQWKQS
tara:strand:- start:41 stop:862 length:822 start_codon:yes stop_codon:yes gene_type:complete